MRRMWKHSVDHRVLDSLERSFFEVKKAKWNLTMFWRFPSRRIDAIGRPMKEERRNRSAWICSVLCWVEDWLENFSFHSTSNWRNLFVVKMATSTEGNGTSGSRGRPIRSGSGTVAPLNTPTRRFYGSHEQIDHREAGIPNPNVYLVHPFKNASLPKDLVYSKKVLHWSIGANFFRQLLLSNCFRESA